MPNEKQRLEGIGKLIASYRISKGKGFSLKCSYLCFANDSPDVLGIGRICILRSR